ncbi:hypothetical protein BKH43_05295 [Helicobacter sp. 13S00401-1]|uniref:hypothetical protein n=1 Tax=Helicobacter sp. 13S00401-1 TaxID=1905758 RepID=UPI000BA69E1B|nr:hypothetical protein [Helicobacter sp. 13S00401-1]PAF50162.1 hypothetical protein BKH43_05295 [Helicobacter sp. 13S00401-1]
MKLKFVLLTTLSALLAFSAPIYAESETSLSESSLLNSLGISTQNTHINHIAEKSGIFVGIGAATHEFKITKVSGTLLLGYTQFFNKYLGIRMYLNYERLPSDYYGGLNIDLIYDIFQGEKLGFGIIAGSSNGYIAFQNKEEGYISQVNAGVSFNFDGGHNRLELLARIPLNNTTFRPLPKAMPLYTFSYTYTF